MERDEGRDSLYLLTGLALVGLGAAYAVGGRRGRMLLQRMQGFFERGQETLCEIQRVLEKCKQLFERGRELLDETREVASQGGRIIKAR